MSGNPMDPSFQKSDQVDEPGIVGAKWWQQGLEEHQAQAVPRRSALLALVLAGGALTVVGGALVLCGIGVASGGEEVDFQTIDKGSLEVQKQYGWNFGAITENLVFDGLSLAAFNRTQFLNLRNDLMPVNGALRPYFWPTLFEAPSALPKTPIEGESPTQPLVEVLKPISTPPMDEAYRRGKGLARMFEKAPNDVAVIVDLPGPESVAFAAGSADKFEPVCTFDNWPHPRGVVPAHQTIAACAYYQPLFGKAQSRRTLSARPMFVLDRKRLNAYTDETRQFDNRYVAKLPPPDGLKKLGILKVLYVVPTSADTVELDDLNSDFVEYERAGIDVKMVAATDFKPNPNAPVQAGDPLEKTDGPQYYYGGDATSGDGFWTDYGWDGGATTKPGAKPTAAKKTTGYSSFGKSYSPTNRATNFTSSTPAASTSPDGSGGMSKAAKVALGTVGVAVAVGTGIVLGTRYGTSRSSGARTGRSGSFGRSSSGFGS